MKFPRWISCWTCIAALCGAAGASAQTVIDPNLGYGAGRRPWAGVAPRTSFNARTFGGASPLSTARSGVVSGYPAPVLQPYGAGVQSVFPENFGGLSTDWGNASLGQSGNSGLLSPAELFSLMTAGALLQAEANMAFTPDLSLPMDSMDLSGEPVIAEPTPRPTGFRLGGDERIELQKRVQQVAWSAFRPEWYEKHPSAILAGLELPPDFDAWETASWQEAASWCGIAALPIEYDFRFGRYQYPLVYQNGTPLGDIVRFGSGAQALVERAAPPQPGVELLPLGVFALVPRGQTAATLLAAVALDKSGTVRGSYLDLPTGVSGPLAGALDQDKQLVAWQTASNPTTVVQTGLSSFTRDLATVLAHSEDGWTRILHSLRLRQPPAAESLSRRDAAPR